MPVLGSSPLNRGGRGFFVPQGALDNFAAALRNHASQLVEVAVLGDSTSFGNNDSEATWSPWHKRLRARMLGAGVTDGGWGWFNSADIAFRDASNPPGRIAFVDPDGFPKVSAVSGSWNGPVSTAAGDTITYQGKGTAIRLLLRVQGAGSPNSGLVGITIDGGTETVYNLLPAVKGRITPYNYQPVIISGLTDGVHTVVVRNAGAPPILDGSSANIVSTPVLGVTGGSLAASTTYEWWLTAQTGSGETTGFRLGQVTTSSTVKQATWQIYPEYGWTSINVYRRVLNTGTYDFIKQVSAGAAGATLNMSDDGTPAPTTSQHPPVTSTAGAFSTAVRTEVLVEFIRSAGVVIHKQAFSGMTMAGYIDVTNNTGREYVPWIFGLQDENTANVDVSPQRYWQLPKGAKPLYRDPKLVIVQLGTNDAGNGSSDGASLTSFNAYLEGLSHVIKISQAAGADVILVSPPFNFALATAANWYQGRYRTALASLASAYNCAYVDFEVALGRTLGTGPAPHLTQARYYAEADFLYDNVIAPLL